MDNLGISKNDFNLFFTRTDLPNVEITEMDLNYFESKALKDKIESLGIPSSRTYTTAFASAVQMAFLASSVAFFILGSVLASQVLAVAYLTSGGLSAIVGHVSEKEVTTTRKIVTFATRFLFGAAVGNNWSYVAEQRSSQINKLSAQLSSTEEKFKNISQITVVENEPLFKELKEKLTNILTGLLKIGMDDNSEQGFNIGFIEAEAAEKEEPFEGERLEFDSSNPNGVNSQDVSKETTDEDLSAENNFTIETLWNSTGNHFISEESSDDDDDFNLTELELDELDELDELENNEPHYIRKTFSGNNRINFTPVLVKKSI